MSKALVVGGTGPTGVHVINSLLERDYDVSILHRGVHEPPGLPDVRHIHADPHFSETLTDATAGEEYDLVLGMYGRVKLFPEVFKNRCGHLVCVGGVPAYRGFIDPASSTPYGMTVNAREDAPLVDTADPVPRFGALILDAERAVLDGGVAYGMRSTVLRYPAIYGPRNLVPWEWAIVKRILDGRPHMIVPDEGLGIISRCAAQNAAAALMSIADAPDTADGQVYNCADDDQFTIRQWVELVAAHMGRDLELVSVPGEVAPSALAELLPPDGKPHVLVDASKIKHELGYREVIPASRALAQAVAWLVEHPVTSAEYPAYPGKFDYDNEDILIAAYRDFLSDVRARGLDVEVERVHGMPHPKTPSLTVDERGR